MHEVTVDCRVSGHVLWLLPDGAVTEYGVQLEQTVKLHWGPLYALIISSLNNTSRYSRSASPPREHHPLSASVFLFPWITVVPALLEVKILAAKERTQVEREIFVGILHHRVWITNGAISSKQKAGVVVTTE